MSFTGARQLAEMIASKNDRAEKIPAIDLRQMNRVIELTPEDMTVTVESGISLGALQSELHKHQQWLPIDPPNADNISIHEVLKKNLSGPRRFGHGTIREHIIGMKVVLADGRTIKSGGKVVKNVAGYDLAKLFIGARDTLGIIVEATFKVQPLPEVERLVSTDVALADANKTLRAVLDSDLTPVIFDMHRSAGANDVSVVLGFAGTRAEVEWQLGIACAFGFVNETTLDYEAEFWQKGAPAHRISVLPSRLVETIASFGAASFVARAGNGVICCRDAEPSAQKNLPTELMRRVKTAFDPKNILQEFTP